MQERLSDSLHRYPPFPFVLNFLNFFVAALQKESLSNQYA